MSKRLGNLTLVKTLSLFGIALSVALSAVHAQTHLAPARDSFCSLGASFDCATVAASPFAVFMGLPWGVWGILGFLCLSIAAYRRSIWLVPLSLFGALTSLALFLISLIQVRSICFLCEGVHVTSFALAFFALKNKKDLQGSFRSLPELSELVAPSAGLALALLLFLPPYWGSFSYKGEPPFATGNTKAGHPWIGSRKPSVVLHEFIDYRCPHCRVTTAATLRRLKKKPTWRVVRRQHPGQRCLSQVKHSCIETRLALCAGDQGQFWRADRYLFSNPQVGTGPDASKMAAALGLDSEKFSKCLKSEKTFKKANDLSQFTYERKIKNTPSYMLNDKLLSSAEAEALFEQ